MTNIENLIALLEKQGHSGARAIVNELQRGGALTDYDAAKYCARHEVLRIVAKESASTTAVIEEVAYRFSLGRNTLCRTIGM